MTRRVNFTSYSDEGNNRTLPDISADQNWVANRSERRVQSEPRYGYNRQQAVALPVAPQNGRMVAKSDASSGHFTTYYDNHVKNGFKGHAMTRRGNVYTGSQSRGTDEKYTTNHQTASDSGMRIDRQFNNNNNNNNNNTMAKNSHAMARSRMGDNQTGPAPELFQRTFGIQTRACEESFLRSNKFATSWAEVRAEIPSYRDRTEQDKPRENSNSPARSPRNDTSRDASPAKSSLASRANIDDYTKVRGRPPTKRGASKSSKKHRSHSSPRETKTMTKRDFVHRQLLSDGESENGSSKFESEDLNFMPNQKQTTQKTVKKPWNDNVNPELDTKPPTPMNSKRYLDSLTFHPKVNQGKEIFETYVGQERNNADSPRYRHATNVDRSEDEDGYDSSGGMSSRSNSSSQERPKHERILNRREAQKYIKMTNVYGSDAYKQQRKEWFLQKLTQVQEEKAKIELEEKREARRKRLEDRTRQRRQLNYVRSKFRNDQERRFRTQYVTARVLEHEQANRHQYGLPEDYHELGYLLQADRDEDTENAPVPKQAKNSKEVTKQSHPKQSGSKSNTKQTEKTKHIGKKKQSGHRSEIPAEEKNEQERTSRVKEKQKSWYRPATVDSPTESQKSPDSHATSGYESSKTPQHENKYSGVFDQNDNESMAFRKSTPGSVSLHESYKHDSFSQNKQRGSTAGSRSQLAERDTINNKNDISSSNNVTSEKETPERKSDSNHKQNQAKRTEATKEKTKLENNDFNAEEVADKSYDFSANNHFGEKSDKKHTIDKRQKSGTQNETGKVGKKDSNLLLKPMSSGLAGVKSKSPLKQTVENDAHNNRLKANDAPATMMTNESTFRKEKEINKESQLQSSVAEVDTKPRGILKNPQHNKYSTNKSPESDRNANNFQSNGKPPNVMASTATSKNSKDVDVPKSSTVQRQATNQNNQPSPKVTEKHSTSQNHVQTTRTKSNQPQAARTDEHKTKNSTTVAERPSKNQAPEGSKSSDKGHHVGQSRSVVTRTSPVSPPKQKTKNEALASQMFGEKAGPSRNTRGKPPKMEGIDTVVLRGKDGKGRSVKQKKNVSDVVKEADNLLKVPDLDSSFKRGNSRQRSYRGVSPDVTLGSDFEVDDEGEDDIFERLRKKYNIAIDSDEDD